MKVGERRARVKAREKDQEKDKESSNKQLLRLNSLIDFLGLSSSGVTIEQIMQHLLDQGLNCTRRTLAKDRNALESMGFPLTVDKDTSLWRLKTQASRGHSLQISPKALVGLYVLKTLAKPISDNPFSEDLNEFFDSLDEILGERGREFLSELTQTMQLAGTSQWEVEGQGSILSLIREACTDRQAIEIEYESISNGIRKRKVGPQNIYFAQGAFHLIAEDLETKKTKTFALPRFKSVVVLDESYEGVTTASDEILTTSFAVFMGSEPEKVDLLFDRELALYVKKKRWHSSQTIKMEADGRLRLQVSLTICPDFVAWVMSFGDKLEIISPASLSREIERQVLNMAERFQLKKVS